jgi:predicted transcriptional regulator
MKYLDKEPLELENRRKIFCFISDKPGTHMRDILRELDMQPGLLSYHLDQLEKAGIIRSETDGYWRRYYLIEGFPMRDRKIVSLFRQSSTREIIILLLENGTMTFQQLLEKLRLSKSTLSHHMKKLTSVEKLIEQSKMERETAYTLIDPEYVMTVLSSLRNSIDDDAADRLANIWSTMSR